MGSTFNELTYTYPVASLTIGGHYANLFCSIQTDRESNLLGAWCSDNQIYCGDLRFQFNVEENDLSPKDTSFFPAYQTTTYQDPAQEVTVTKRIFIPYHEGYQRNVFFLLHLENTAKTEKTLRININMTYPALLRQDTPFHTEGFQASKTVTSVLKEGVVFTETDTCPEEVRLFGTMAPPTEYEFSDQTTRLVYTQTLGPESKSVIPFILTLSNQGLRGAVKGFREALNYQSAFNRTNLSLQYILDACHLYTPNARINRGMQWAKINAIRIQNKGVLGHGLSHTPPYTTLSARDAAWFVLGMDYVMPDFSQDVIDIMTQYGIGDEGKVLEAIDLSGDPSVAVPCTLNISDDTPLFIVSCYHYFVTTKNRTFIEGIYPALRKVATWIAAQIQEGLVYSRKAPETAPSGANGSQSIASWRNITPDYPVEGIITEVNTECYRALDHFARLAGALGKTDDQKHFSQAAQTLKTNINQKLRTKESGLYFLNIDPAGTPHEVLTGDLIFPAITGVAERDVAQKILTTLDSAAFITPVGVRTVATSEPIYDPSKGENLLGGIWPNLTAWVAFGHRKTHPEKVAAALDQLFSLCEPNPPHAMKNIVPGQFPQRLHGETFQSEGLPLSPWMGPTYVWLGMEGLLGFEPTPEGLVVNPALPPAWQWVAARDIQYAEDSISLICHQGTLYANAPIDSPLPVEYYEKDWSDFTRANVFTVVLGREKEILIFCASTQAKQAEITLHKEILGEEKSFSIPLKAGEAKLWMEPRP